MECTVEGCVKPIKVKLRGLCGMHYARWNRTGTVELDPFVKAECSIEGCVSEVKSRGWCRKHYQRFIRHGDPILTHRLISPTREAAFLARVSHDGECLVWTGATSGFGYGKMLGAEGKMIYAHRYAWEREHGPIPERGVIDHICFNTLCVNVEHLRLVDQSGNMQNRQGAQRSNASGVRGVGWSSSKRAWRAFLKIRGKTMHLGYFDDLEEADRAAAEARRLSMPFTQN